MTRGGFLGPAAIAVALLLVAAAPAAAKTVPGIQQVSLGSGDWVYNYDFKSKDARADNVDWPVTLLFWNNAEVDKVKNKWCPWWDLFRCSGPGVYEYMLLKDGSSSYWDQDTGRKKSISGWDDSWHVRFYAPYPSDRGYSLELGYWVVATTHKHNDEITKTNKWTGYSEETEEKVANDLRAKGWLVEDDKVWFNNVLDEWQGTSYLQSNGYATKIKVP